jgi:hypothetical protein
VAFYKTIYGATTVTAGAVSISLGSTGWQRLASVQYSFSIVGTAGYRLYTMQLLDSSSTANVLYQQFLDNGLPSTSPTVTQTLPARLLMPPGAVIKVYGAGNIPSVTDTVAANIVAEDA